MVSKFSGYRFSHWENSREGDMRVILGLKIRRQIRIC